MDDAAVGRGEEVATSRETMKVEVAENGTSGDSKPFSWVNFETGWKMRKERMAQMSGFPSYSELTSTVVKLFAMPLLCGL
jgi:hypothetical protein